MTDMPTPDEALEQFKQMFDPADESGGLPMLWYCTEDDKVTIMALAMGDMPMQEILARILPAQIANAGRPKWLMLTAESWRKDPETYETVGECVMITGASQAGGVWARIANFERDTEAGTVQWEEPSDIEPGHLAGGVPTLLLRAFA